MEPPEQILHAGPGPGLVASDRSVISPIVLWSSLTLLFVLGLAFRLRGLSELGFLVDEGNQALAISGILNHGLPVSESGWPYPRNLLFQYIQAASALQFGLNELSMRLPSAVFGAASIVTSFALARAIFGDRVALLTAALVCLSIWEISLSRYARPYTALQFFYGLGLLCFYRGYIQGVRPFRLGFFLTLVVLIPIHEFGVVLATCFAIPFLMGDAWSARGRLFGLATAAGIGFFWLAYQRLSSALIGQLAPPHGLTHLPAVLAQSREGSWWFGPRIWGPDLSSVTRLVDAAPLATVVPVGLALVGGVLLFRRIGASQPARLPLLGAMLVAAALHQIGLALLLGVADLVIFARREAPLDRAVLPAWLAVGGLLAFWSLALLPQTQGWREPTLLLFGYPNVLQHCIYFLATGWPFVLVGGIAGCVLLMHRLVQNRHSPEAAFALGALLIPTVATSFFRSFFEARYVFHLFPLLLAIYGFAAVRLADALALRAPVALRRPAFIGVILVALLATGEANPVAAWEVGRRDYASRLNPAKGVLSWQAYADFHQDHKTPSLYLASKRDQADRVVVMGAPHMIGVYAHYLDRIDLAIGRPQDRGYLRRRGDTNVGWMTGIPTITQTQELREVLRRPTAGTTWLVADRVLLRDDNPYFAEDMKEVVRDLAPMPEYVGRDEQTFVARVAQ